MLNAYNELMSPENAHTDGIVKFLWSNGWKAERWLLKSHLGARERPFELEGAETHLGAHVLPIYSPVTMWQLKSVVILFCIVFMFIHINAPLSTSANTQCFGFVVLNICRSCWCFTAADRILDCQRESGVLVNTSFWKSACIGWLVYAGKAPLLQKVYRLHLRWGYFASVAYPNWFRFPLF